MGKVGICPKCNEEKKLTRHHVYPRTHYRDDTIEHICRECHDELEIFIVKIEGRKRNGKRNKLEKFLYPLIFNSFIQKSICHELESIIQTTQRRS